jgi:hypothetical protein
LFLFVLSTILVVASDLDHKIRWVYFINHVC